MNTAYAIMRNLVDRNYRTITGDLIPDVAGIKEGYNYFLVTFINGVSIRIEDTTKEN